MIRNEAALFEERRKEIRYPLCGLVPLWLTHRDQEKPIDTVFLDVSNRGLGVLCEPGLQVDKILWLNVNQRINLPMSVRWVKKPSGVFAQNIPDFYRAGLCLVDNDGPAETHDLIEILTPFNCIDD